jgi:hypothetical protein
VSATYPIRKLLIYHPENLRVNVTGRIIKTNCSVEIIVKNVDAIMGISRFSRIRFRGNGRKLGFSSALF